MFNAALIQPFKRCAKTHARPVVRSYPAKNSCGVSEWATTVSFIKFRIMSCWCWWSRWGTAAKSTASAQPSTAGACPLGRLATSSSSKYLTVVVPEACPQHSVGNVLYLPDCPRVIALLAQQHVLDLTKDCFPRQPLHVPASIPARPYPSRSEGPLWFPLHV